jgi:hypothetical protein
MMALFYVSGLKHDDALDAIVEAPDVWHAENAWLYWLDTIGGGEAFPQGTHPYSIKEIPQLGTGGGQSRVVPWDDFMERRDGDQK